MIKLKDDRWPSSTGVIKRAENKFKIWTAAERWTIEIKTFFYQAQLKTLKAHHQNLNHIYPKVTEMEKIVHRPSVSYGKDNNYV